MLILSKAMASCTPAPDRQTSENRYQSNPVLNFSWKIWQKPFAREGKLNDYRFFHNGNHVENSLENYQSCSYQVTLSMASPMR
ncbi:hypothetical protein QUC31_009512 [Theobroma cacao]